MRKITVFDFTSLDGYFSGPGGDTSWHQHSAAGSEEGDFSGQNAQSESVLLFGRTTFEMMRSFWPTATAAEQMPETADGMNKSPKIVFSNTLTEPGWNNTTILKGDIVAQMKKMKETPGKDMTILGSGSIVRLFTEHKLIDEFHIMIDPVLLGKGKTLFEGMEKPVKLELIDTRIFKSGAILASYAPAS